MVLINVVKQDETEYTLERIEYLDSNDLDFYFSMACNSYYNVTWSCILWF